MTPEELYFITFPQRITALRNCYLTIIARSEGEARDIAFQSVGTQWAFMYTGREELDRQIALFHLVPTTLEHARGILNSLGESPMSTTENPLDVQPGGNHYNRLPYQPIEFSMENQLDPCAFSILRYLTRFEEKGQPVLDLEKALHYMDLRQHFADLGLKSALPRPEGLRVPMSRFSGQAGITHASYKLLVVLGQYLTEPGASPALRTAITQELAVQRKATEADKTTGKATGKTKKS